MKHRYATVLVIFIVATLFEIVKAKEWRGIIPLHSTRVDVERLLGNVSPKKQLTTYQTKKDAVSVLYASGPPCGSDAGSEWKVPRDTVVSITVAPKDRVFLSELEIDLRTYDKFSGIHRPNIITYLNKEEGTRIETFQDEVTSITYFAAASDSPLKCEPNERKQRPRKEKGVRKEKGIKKKGSGLRFCDSAISAIRTIESCSGPHSHRKPRASRFC